jgi:hypothetical protein
MATEHLYGDAELEYDSGVYTVVHQLAVPLMVVPADSFQLSRGRQRWESWNADDTLREVFVLGTAVSEIQATVRMENDPEGLMQLLVAGLEEDAELTYRPHGPLGEEYPCKLVGVVGSQGGRVTLKPDRVRWSLGEYEATLVLRRVDGGTFEQLLVRTVSP